MIGHLLGLAAGLAVLAVAVRALYQRIVERAQPGARPANAIPVQDYAEIDFAVRSRRCHCGGSYVLRGEGPARDTDRPIRVAHLECRRCQRAQRIYFDLSGIRH